MISSAYLYNQNAHYWLLFSLSAGSVANTHNLDFPSFCSFYVVILLLQQNTLSKFIAFYVNFRIIA